MSAIAAKVSSGLMKLATAAPAKRTPKTANNHFSRGAIAISPNCCRLANANRIDQDADCVDRAWSNWRITTAATVHQDRPAATTSVRLLRPRHARPR